VPCGHHGCLAGDRTIPRFGPQAGGGKVPRFSAGAASTGSLSIVAGYDAPMRIAVVGGGINGVMSATSLRASGHEVELLERGRLMGATSSASTKLLHGGLRYLEHGSFRLVREALQERAWWLRSAPHLCQPVRLLLPVRRSTGRPRVVLGLGLTLYDWLAGTARIAYHRWLGPAEVLSLCPGLRSTDLVGAYEFWDGQMDDHALGLWAAAAARAAGVDIRESCEVSCLSADGSCTIEGVRRQFDAIVNCTGPWAERLLAASGMQTRFRLDLVRGSHLVSSRPCPTGILAEVPGSRRIAFILPWKTGTLIGTTEVRQSLDDPIRCSAEEESYLRAFHDSLMSEPLDDREVVERFAGVRPLIRSAADPSRATREYEIDRQGKVLTVYGGKWTTARALGQRVAAAVGSA